MSASLLNDYVYRFSIIEAYYSEEYEKYIFKGNWASSITEEYFNSIIEKIETDLLYQLKVGSNNDQYLKELLEITGKSIDLFREHLIGELIKKAKDADINISDNIPLPPTVLVGRDYELPDPSVESPVAIEDYIINKQESLTIEQKYLYRSYLFFQEAIVKLNSIIMRWEQDLPFTDFSKIELSQITNKEENVKCHSKLSKIDLARLFYFLRENKILFMDSTSSRNNSELNKFIESNFTYLSSTTKEQEEIKGINKEFSVVSGALYKEDNIEFFQKLVNDLQKMIAKCE